MSEHPCVPLGIRPSFGFGDRIGCATPGHVAAMKRSGVGIDAIFPQQSIREMTRTNRTPRNVMDDAIAGAQAAGWEGRIGADADHLKTTEDVDRTFEVGFTFFTIDPSGYVDQQADNYDEQTVRRKYEAGKDLPDWTEQYAGQTIGLATGTKIQLTEEACMRAAVKYGRAVQEAIKLGSYIRKLHEDANRDYEIELSVDETEQPTTLAEHYIVADQCFLGELKLISLAPRFIGDFEKGVDFKGDLERLEQSLHDHSAIAQLIGPYKLSLHSGSDKLSMYPALARATNGLFHVKTAGTSYLEALRVVARHDERLFREMIHFARDRYEHDRATYHVSASLDTVPVADALPHAQDVEREYLELWEDVPQGRGFTKPGRQILHCTFGSTLTHPQFGPTLCDLLKSHPETYQQVLEDHFARHLDALQAGLS